MPLPSQPRAPPPSHLRRGDPLPRRRGSARRTNCKVNHGRRADQSQSRTPRGPKSLTGAARTGQAADLTGGVYFRPELGELGGGALQQWLLTLFLADRTVRFAREAAEGQGDAGAAGAASAGDPLLRLPVATQVDYRSACFSTGALIDQGFVCSVCLTIYGKEVSWRLSLPSNPRGAPESPPPRPPLRVRRMPQALGAALTAPLLGH